MQEACQTAKGTNDAPVEGKIHDTNGDLWKGTPSGEIGTRPGHFASFYHVVAGLSRVGSSRRVTQCALGLQVLRNKTTFMSEGFRESS